MKIVISQLFDIVFGICLLGLSNLPLAHPGFPTRFVDCRQIFRSIEYAVLHLKPFGNRIFKREIMLGLIQVENIVVIGHSCYGGIKGVMSIPEDGSTGRLKTLKKKRFAPAKTKVKTELSFSEQCTNCEKEDVNESLRNQFTYPFVREAVSKKCLELKGAHYDFVNGNFDLWNLDFKLTPTLAL
ncbi:hypothetical protein CXB51_032218 [Gossypium anomalum]|uniref:Carbonic anhydrase n=1 Tax=Gossypium anomalum TaxID=47600 RepID=A0A8J5Y5J2_9ROSI|nr:hypothetical protein CXB51_032218 [Gossypium anomalum]